MKLSETYRTFPPPSRGFETPADILRIITDNSSGYHVYGVLLEMLLPVDACSAHHLIQGEWMVLAAGILPH